MRIKAVCEATGLTDRTIRYYIEEKLITPDCTENYLGRKSFDFSEATVHALEQIAVLRKFGFSIPEIRLMLAEPEQIHRIIAQLRERKRSVIREETELLQTLEKLDAQRAYTVPELAEDLSAPVANTPVHEEVLDIKTVLKLFGYIGQAAISLIAVCAVIILILIIAMFVESKMDYKTNNLEDYGEIVGNIDNNEPQEFVFSFFPAEIEEYFSQPKYHYKAVKGNTYAYEAWLEFVIEDKAQFDAYVSSLPEAQKITSFTPAPSYTDYTYGDYLRFSQGADGEYRLHAARMGKILVSESEQHIIYFATGVSGGDVPMEDLGYYWENFSIHP